MKHTYTLDGAKILKETWGDCTLIPLYDNEDSVCGIIYNDAAYYALGKKFHIGFEVPTYVYGLILNVIFN